MNNFYKILKFTSIAECFKNKSLLLLFLLTFFQQTLSAQSFSATDQVILSSASVFNDDGARGFAFTPNTTIYITEIGLRTPDSNTSFEFIIWERGTATKVHQQTITISTVGDYEYFPVTAPITLSSGVQYLSTFYGLKNDGYYIQTGNPQINTNLTYHSAILCANGGCDTNTMPMIPFPNAHYGAPDFMFQLTDPSSNPKVPTLSEWGLIILALLLMTLGVLYLVQPNWRRRFEQNLPRNLGE